MEPKKGSEESTVTVRSSSRSVPAGDVMIKRVRGPQQGQNVFLGMVKTGRIYTVDLATAVILTGKDGEFEALPEFADEIEAAREAARKAAK